MAVRMRILPFGAMSNPKLETTNIVSSQLENLIKKYADEGWNYVSLESVSTYVPPDSGCFGIGSTPGGMTSCQMVVFSK